MIDSMTSKPLCVIAVGTAGPYMIVPVSQLDAICELFDQQGINYWVDEEFISLGGEPETAFVNFGRAGNATAIQAILDSVQ